MKAAQQVKEREDEANVQVNKRMVGGVAQVPHFPLSSPIQLLLSASLQPGFPCITAPNVSLPVVYYCQLLTVLRKLCNLTYMLTLT